ncbi:MAG: ADP/ATP-dependent (S)-NAD(P)H-hydrate dehydratase, partial [Longimicrobiales bacterium]
VVGGEIELPGAIILAGIAALRAGAGKLQLATCKSIAPQVGIAVPESLSISLDETREGTIARDAARQLKAHTVDLDAILIGPGTRAGNDNTAFVTRLLQQCRHVPVILDAGALDALHDEPDALSAHDRNAILTPHWGEISRLLSIDLSVVATRPAVVARQAAESLQAVVVLKGARSFIATP